MKRPDLLRINLRSRAWLWHVVLPSWPARLSGLLDVEPEESTP